MNNYQTTIGIAKIIIFGTQIIWLNISRAYGILKKHRWTSSTDTCNYNDTSDSDSSDFASSNSDSTSSDCCLRSNINTTARRFDEVQRDEEGNTSSLANIDKQQAAKEQKETKGKPKIKLGKREIDDDNRHDDY